MTTVPLKKLEAEVERLVGEHLAAQRRAVEAAVARAFAAALSPRGAPAARRARPAAAGSTTPRRSPEQMSSVVERLLAAVRAQPGETMTVLAAALSEPPRALNRPMDHLKRGGRVRSAGQRNRTRYFPMSPTRAA